MVANATHKCVSWGNSFHSMYLHPVLNEMNDDLPQMILSVCANRFQEVLPVMRLLRWMSVSPPVCFGSGQRHDFAAGTHARDTLASPAASYRVQTDTSAEPMRARECRQLALETWK